jgi:quinol monooxygenase YgiN
MHARIGTFDVPPQRMDEALVFFRERIVSAFSAHDGFLGYRAYVDRERGRLVGISLWTTRSALDASRETARGVLSEATHLGAVTVAEPEILELAFDARPSS